MKDKGLNIEEQHVSVMEDFPNPFPGLRPFTSDESHLFFGRDGQCDEILSSLQHNRFVSVLGASGSGKSSLMYCGLIPILHGGFLTDAGSHWKIITSRPGINPIENLAHNLLQLDESYQNASDADKKIKKVIINSYLKSSSLGLVEAVAQLVKDQTENVLLMVDQFEELFRFSRMVENDLVNDEASEFVNLLLEAVSQREVPIYVAMTMRSDFIGNCAQFPKLTNMINASHYLIPQMTRDQKKMAVEGPVAVGFGTITSRLVQQLLNDVGDNPDQLPILQHALMRTWDYWMRSKKDEEDPLDIQHYEAIGRMSEALSIHANEAYDELDEEEKAVCRQLFKAITEKGIDNQGIRRPTKLDQISSITNVGNETLVRIIDRFRKPGRSLLMPPIDIEITAETVIDISHESLMRNWVRLKNWVEEEAESVRMYKKLSESAANNQIGKGGLLRQPDLQLALNWQQEQKPTLDWAIRYDEAYERVEVFLDTSRNAYESEQRNKALKQKRDLQRARIVAIVLGLASVISIGFYIFANSQTVVAKREKAKAEVSLRNAVVSQVAATHEKFGADLSKRASEISLVRADNLSNELRAEKDKFVLLFKEAERLKIIAQDATAQALALVESEREAKLLAEANRIKAVEAGEETKVALDLSEKLNKQILAQAMATKSTNMAPEVRDLKSALALQAYQFHIENEGDEHDTYIYNGLYSGLKALKGNDFNVYFPKNNIGASNDVNGLVYSSDGRSIYAAIDHDASSRVVKWDVITKKTTEYSSKVLASNDLEISPNSRWLVNAGFGDILDVFDLYDPSRAATRVRTEGSVADIEFMANSEGFYTAGDQFVYKYDFEDYTTVIKAEDKVQAISSSSNGELLAAGCANGDLLIYDQNGYQLLNSFKKASNGIRSVKFSSNNKWLAVGYENGLVTVYDVSTKRSAKLVNNFSGHTSHVNDLAFSPDNLLLASGASDNTARIWNLERSNNLPIVIQDEDEVFRVSSLEFSPDGKSLMIGCDRSQIQIWPIDLAQMANQYCDQLNRNMTEEEWSKYVGDEEPYRKTCSDLQSEVSN